MQVPLATFHITSTLTYSPLLNSTISFLSLHVLLNILSSFTFQTPFLREILRNISSASFPYSFLVFTSLQAFQYYLVLSSSFPLSLPTVSQYIFSAAHQSHSTPQISITLPIFSPIFSPFWYLPFVFYSYSSHFFSIPCLFTSLLFFALYVSLSIYLLLLFTSLSMSLLPFASFISFFVSYISTFLSMYFWRMLHLYLIFHIPSLGLHLPLDKLHQEHT